jgi:hypothetical protein
MAVTAFWSRTTALIAIVALFLVGGVAWAAIPGSNGVITGCRHNSTGALRVIDAEAGATCAGNETQLTWNQQGPQGPAGIVGFYSRSSEQTVPGSSNQTIGMDCLAGDIAVSAGYDMGANRPLKIYTIEPQEPNLQQWNISVANESVEPQPIRYEVLCAELGG